MGAGGDEHALVDHAGAASADGDAVDQVRRAVDRGGDGGDRRDRVDEVEDARGRRRAVHRAEIQRGVIVGRAVRLDRHVAREEVDAGAAIADREASGGAGVIEDERRAVGLQVDDRRAREDRVHRGRGRGERERARQDARGARVGERTADGEGVARGLRELARAGDIDRALADAKGGDARRVEVDDRAGRGRDRRGEIGGRGIDRDLTAAERDRLREADVRVGKGKDAEAVLGQGRTHRGDRARERQGLQRALDGDCMHAGRERARAGEREAIDRGDAGYHEAAGDGIGIGDRLDRDHGADRRAVGDADRARPRAGARLEDERALVEPDTAREGRDVKQLERARAGLDDRTAQDAVGAAALDHIELQPLRRKTAHSDRQVRAIEVERENVADIRDASGAVTPGHDATRQAVVGRRSRDLEHRAGAAGDLRIIGQTHRHHDEGVDRIAADERDRAVAGEDEVRGRGELLGGVRGEIGVVERDVAEHRGAGGERERTGVDDRAPGVGHRAAEGDVGGAALGEGDRARPADDGILGVLDGGVESLRALIRVDHEFGHPGAGRRTGGDDALIGRGAPRGVVVVVRAQDAGLLELQRVGGVLEIDVDREAAGDAQAADRVESRRKVHAGGRVAHEVGDGTADEDAGGERRGEAGQILRGVGRAAGRTEGHESCRESGIAARAIDRVVGRGVDHPGRQQLAVGHGDAAERPHHELAVADARLAVGVEVDRGPRSAGDVAGGHLREAVAADVHVDDIVAGGEGERAEGLGRRTGRLSLVGERAAGEGDRRVVRQAVVVVRVAGVIDGELGEVERDAGARKRGRMEELKGAAADRRRAGVSQRAHQRERATTLLIKAQRAAGVLDKTGVGDVPVLAGAADDQAHRRGGGVVDDRPRGRQQGETVVAAGRGEIADLQAIAVEVERSVVHVDRDGRRVGVARRGDERRAELERAAVDGDVAREEKRAVQDERAAVGLRETP